MIHENNKRVGPDESTTWELIVGYAELWAVLPK